MLIPIGIIFLKIKHKEYDEPKLLIAIAIFVIVITAGFYYLDWFNWNYGGPIGDPNYYRKQYFNFHFQFLLVLLAKLRVGRLAQLVEHLVYTERVGSSSLSPPTIN